MSKFSKIFLAASTFCLCFALVGCGNDAVEKVEDKAAEATQEAEEKAAELGQEVQDRLGSASKTVQNYLEGLIDEDGAIAELKEHVEAIEKVAETDAELGAGAVVEGMKSLLEQMKELDEEAKEDIKTMLSSANEEIAKLSGN